MITKTILNRIEKMSVYLTAGLTGTGAIVGGAIGYGVGGIKGATEGGKMGAAAGTRIAILAKGGKTKDSISPASEAKTSETGSETSTTEKTSKVLPITSAGEKQLLSIAEKSSEAIMKVCKTGGRCIEELADVWSKMALSGYAISIGFSGSVTALEHYDKYCDTALQSINCVAMSATHLSTNALLVTCFICIGYKVFCVLTTPEVKNNG